MTRELLNTIIKENTWNAREQWEIDNLYKLRDYILELENDNKALKGRVLRVSSILSDEKLKVS